MEAGRIELQPRDFSDETLKECAQTLVELILDDVAAFDALTELLKVSVHWSKGNFEQKYDSWKSKYMDYHELADEGRFDRTVKECFEKAELSSGWSELRGMVAERVVEAAFRRWHACKANGEGIAGEIYTGCAVCLDGTPVVYVCSEKKAQKEKCANLSRECLPSGECKGDRKTVDVGVVTVLPGTGKYRLDCVETKLSPDSFAYLEGAYLEKLKHELDFAGVKSNIIVASLEQRSKLETRVRICMGDSSFVTLWGGKEVRRLLFDAFEPIGNKCTLS